MIDNACILLTVGMCLYVAYRAIQLDRLLPWFGPMPAAGLEDDPAPISRPGATRLASAPRASTADEPAATIASATSSPSEAINWRSRAAKIKRTGAR